MVNFVTRFPKILVLACWDLSNQEKYWFLWFSNSNFAILSIFLLLLLKDNLFPYLLNEDFRMLHVVTTDSVQSEANLVFVYHSLKLESRYHQRNVLPRTRNVGGLLVGEVKHKRFATKFFWPFWVRHWQQDTPGNQLTRLVLLRSPVPKVSKWVTIGFSW